MSSSYVQLFAPLQPDPSAAPGAAGVAASGGAPSSPLAPGGCAVNMGLLAVMLILMYLLMIRPQQKQQRAVDAMLRSLKKGTVVRTRGGIRGEITALGDKDVTLQIAERVKINVLRSHIANVETTGSDDSPSEKATAERQGGADEGKASANDSSSKGDGGLKS